MKVVCDTSALVFLAEVVANDRRREILSNSLLQRVGQNPEFVFHPLTLCELASNTHDEIHHGRRGMTVADFRPKSRQIGEKFRSALVLLNSWGVKDPVLSQPIALKLELDYWSFVAGERMEYQSLSCDSNGNVCHQLAAADNLIFQTSRFLQFRGEEVAVFSGDNAIITAADRFGITWCPVYPSNAPKAWKNCKENNSCYLGIGPSIGAGCPQRFLGP